MTQKSFSHPVMVGKWDRKEEKSHGSFIVLFCFRFLVYKRKLQCFLFKFLGQHHKFHQVLFNNFANKIFHSSLTDLSIGSPDMVSPHAHIPLLLFISWNIFLVQNFSHIRHDVAVPKYNKNRMIVPREVLFQNPLALAKHFTQTCKRFIWHMLTV